MQTFTKGNSFQSLQLEYFLFKDCHSNTLLLEEEKLEMGFSIFNSHLILHNHIIWNITTNKEAAKYMQILFINSPF